MGESSQPGPSTCSPPSPAPTVLYSNSSVSSACTSTPSSREGDIRIPDHWRPEIEQCLEEKRLTDSARNDVVRTLVSQLFARSNKPNRYQCESLARRLILKYPFLKDDLGNGYVSICMYDFSMLHMV